MHRRIAGQGSQYADPEGEVAGPNYAEEEARPAGVRVRAHHRAAHNPRRQKRHNADGDSSASQADRQVPGLHRPILRDQAPPTRPGDTARMTEPDRRRRSRSGQVLDGVVWGAALGAASGAVLGDAVEGLGAGLGALTGTALYAPAEVITSSRRGPAQPKPLWYRILNSALLMALFGWLLGRIYAEPLFIAILSGALLGVLGLRPGKAALGLLVGSVVGVLFQALDDSVEPALVAAAVALAYRVIAAIAYRGRELVRVMAEEVPASELRYVVPFAARSRYVGGDYVEQLAKTHGGTFRRNPPDVGILASLDSLEGPTFDPTRVHPLIREFYEHTSRF